MLNAEVMSPWRRLCSGIYYWYRRNIWRRIPHLVWPGQEVDVRICFSEDPLNPETGFDGLFSGGLYEVEKRLRNMGIDFDTGQGPEGRDWEWDFALRGPISVTFKSKATHPERRRRPPTPKLAVNNVA